MAKFLVSPSIVQNPNPRAPLAALLRFTIDSPASVRVFINDGKNAWTVSFPPQEGEANLPIAGLRADRLHTFRIEIDDCAGGKTQAHAEYRPPALPSAP